MMDAISEIRSARALYATGDAPGAYRNLVQLFGSGPGPIAAAGASAEAIGLLAELARTFGDAKLADNLDACARRPSDARGLYDVAYDLYEQRQFAAASALLYRANALAPGR